ncbi:MAG: response regulator [Pseudomonadales bacterium]|nr:response regulator [Pseudomonadales bacterium]
MLKKIPVVDDDPGLRDLLKKYLDENGFDTEMVEDAIALDAWLKEKEADFIILDLMLPGEDGLSIARRLRVSNQVPVIMLTASGEELDRIIGLEIGADDYLSKPFNPRELLARIRAVLRRSELTSKASIKNKSPLHNTDFGDFQFNHNSKLLYKNGNEVELTSGETSLLEIFLAHPNHVLSRDQIMDYLSDHTHDQFDRSIDVRITRLRAKVESDTSSPTYIRTVWGKGYRFTISDNTI